jgi:hypothetical protein
LPDCADVQAEWLGSKLDVDLQFHILNAVYGSKISLNSLRRVLSNLGVEYTNDESIGQRILSFCEEEKNGTIPRAGTHHPRKVPQTGVHPTTMATTYPSVVEEQVHAQVSRSDQFGSIVHNYLCFLR